MSDENKIANDSKEEPKISENDTKITIKKSSYNNMLKGIVVAIAIATFFGGYAIGTLDDDSDSLSADEIKEIISELEAKAPAPQPTQAPTQAPTNSPTAAPTNDPTQTPTAAPKTCGLDDGPKI